MLIEESAPSRDDTAAQRRAGVVDLRGSVATAGAAPGVLEDPSGRRRRRMARIARAAAIVLALWLVALVLGGLGLFPSGALPLGGAVERTLSPPDRAPGGDVSAPRGESRSSDTKPARSPEAGRDAGARDNQGAPNGARPGPTASPRRTTSQRRAPDRTTPATPRRDDTGSSAAPAPPVASPGPAPASQGQPAAPGPQATSPRRTSPGRDTAPGQTQTPPGQTTDTSVTTPTAPGQSGSHRNNETGGPAARTLTG